MKVYKRTAWSLIKSIIAAPMAGLGLWIGIVIVLAILEQVMTLGVWANYVLWGLPILGFLFMLYEAFLGEAIKFELDEDGHLRYFKRNKLRQEFDLKKCGIGYFIKTKGASYETVTLKILTDGGEEMIDVLPLGYKQFEEMYEVMQKLALKEASEELEIKKKNRR